MIEYNISLCFDGASKTHLQNFHAVDHPFFRFEVVRDGKKLEQIEARETAKDCTIDVALSQFLDHLDALGLEIVEGTATLKIESYFSVSRVAALNFEINPKTLTRLANLKITFDLWAMPCD